MKYQTDITADFDVEYVVTRPRQPARGDEPPSGPEFNVTGCGMVINEATGYRVPLQYHDLPEWIREEIEEAIVEEIDDGD